MFRWYHAIVSAYGFRLPNHPRGSGSAFVCAHELFRFGGAATTVTGKRSYAHDPHDASFRRKAKTLLKFPPVRFDGPMHAAMALGFAEACEKSGVVLHACAIGHDHVHVIVARHETLTIERVVSSLKSAATRRLSADRLHPLARYASDDDAAPTPWSEGCWKVFINDEAQLHSAIAYVVRHPMKEGLAAQPWDFLVPFSR